MDKPAVFFVLLGAVIVAALAGTGPEMSDEERKLRELTTFDCPAIAPPNETATSVHRLRPSDIKVIMALGDSVTAGLAMMGDTGSVKKDLMEYRGQSWLIGADAQAQTLATFFKNYSPNLVGGSVGEHLVQLCWGTICPGREEPATNVLNAALSGAMMYDFVNGPKQVDYLLEQLRTKFAYIDMEKDWKLLSIFVGANDMCYRCEHFPPEPTSQADYEEYFRMTLTKLRANVPRLLVNVALLFNVSQVYELSKNITSCRIKHAILPIECYCALEPGARGDRFRKVMDETAVAYNQALVKVAAEFNANRSDSFAVVIQPAMRDGVLSSFPVSFISTLDCFHPSLLAHQLMAKVMWNNMWTPSAEKSTTFEFKKPFKCPTAESTIPTD